MSPEHFAEQLEHLRKQFVPFRLRELVKALLTGRLPKRGVVLTFDDGYADNLWNAYPLLERYAVPATIFVSAGYLESDREFWWDELERLMLLTPILPRLVRATVEGTEHEWDIGEWTTLPKADAPSHPQSRVLSGEDPTPRHRACRDLHRLMRPLGYEQREAVLATLRSQAKSNGQRRSGYRALTVDEVCRLGKTGLVEIGAHTVTHPVLATQPFEVQRQEIVKSKDVLEKILQEPVTSFCYPFGTWEDVGPTTIQLVEETGYTSACSSLAGTVTRRANAYWLPRVMVCDWDGDTFARRVREFFQ